MGKGWGLTLENSEQVGFFLNKPIFGFNLSPRMNHSKGSMFAGVDFSPNIGRSEQAAAAAAAAASSSSPGDEKRTVAGEMDFFSDKKRAHDIVKKENSIDEDTTQKDLNVNTGLQLVTANTGSDQSTVDDSVSSDVEDKRAKSELAKLQIQLQQMHAENQRLKGMLTQVTNNYGALQIHMQTLMLQHQNSPMDIAQEQQQAGMKLENGRAIVPIRQFLDLGPGAITEGREEPETHSSSEERTRSGSPPNNVDASKNKMMAREESPESESWAPNKVPKLNPSKSSAEDATEATMRKARVSVRARSEAPMISDGCQWRKYGQKMAKGNPCPRAYYRCTMAVGCPVRKQVQRCADDRSILITTYEGNHNHPLPPAAMAMASTTSAAVNMLLSGSMPSADGLMNPNFLARAILPCSSSMATISASAPFPTVTLDLTQSPNPLHIQRPPSQFQLPFSSPPQNYPSAASSAQIPQVFGQALHNQSKFSGLQLSQDHIQAGAQLLQQSQHPQLQQAANQVSLADTLSAATAAITADPNFTAALAAAITSIIGGSQGNSSGNTTSGNINLSTSNHKSNSFSGNQ